MKSAAAVVAAGLVLVGLVFLGGTAAGEGGNTIAEAIDTAESVETGLEVASDTTTQLLSGAAVGTGVGLLVGSGVTFIYWRRELQ
ncbi:hypothetical protein [Halovenus salina]|uniref:hypothetical protein n=1 Tax=Halovenus salina TaxID=1510225 RepID=UPI002260B2E6|nr:hypothetical protein [Halovenus salina]